MGEVGSLNRREALRNLLKRAEDSYAESEKAGKEGRLKEQSDELKFAGSDFHMASLLARKIGEKEEAIRYAMKAVECLSNSAKIYSAYIERKVKESPNLVRDLAMHYKWLAEIYEKAANISWVYGFKEAAQLRRNTIKCYGKSAEIAEGEIISSLRFAVDRYFDIAFNHFLDENLNEAVKTAFKALKMLEKHGYTESGWHMEAKGLNLLNEAKKNNDASMLKEALKWLKKAMKKHFEENEAVASGRVREIVEMVSGEEAPPPF